MDTLAESGMAEASSQEGVARYLVGRNGRDFYRSALLPHAGSARLCRSSIGVQVPECPHAEPEASIGDAATVALVTVTLAALSVAWYQLLGLSRQTRATIVMT